jgi:hypothetical protein
MQAAPPDKLLNPPRCGGKSSGIQSLRSAGRCPWSRSRWNALSPTRFNCLGLPAAAGNNRFNRSRRGCHVPLTARLARGSWIKVPRPDLWCPFARICAFSAPSMGWPPMDAPRVLGSPAVGPDLASGPGCRASTRSRSQPQQRESRPADERQPYKRAGGVRARLTDVVSRRYEPDQRSNVVLRMNWAGSMMRKA